MATSELTPRLHQTKRERITEREDAIVDAAREAFLKGGLRGARMAEIAQRAGVAEGTLYLYYKNKSDLMRAVVAQHWDDLTRGAHQAVERAGDRPVDQLEALVRFHLDLLISDWPLLELSFSLTYMEGDDPPSSYKRDYVVVLDQVLYRGRDKGVFSAKVDTRVLRDMVFGTLEYAARSALLMVESKRREHQEHSIETLMIALLAVLQKPKQSELPPDAMERLHHAIDRLEGLSSV
ncbi:MAG: TetR/AcrR family transcriptional regulator [Pseudomonadota bacterium]